MQRALLLTTLAVLTATVFATPASGSYYRFGTIWEDDWDASQVTISGNQWKHLAQQQTSTSNPDIAYITSVQTSTTTTLTLYAQVNGQQPQIIRQHVDSAPYTTHHCFYQPDLTIKHDQNGEVYYYVGWIEEEWVNGIVTTTGWYRDSREPLHDPIPDGQPKRNQITFSSIPSPLQSNYDTTPSSANKIRYSLTMNFYDPNHYSWSYGKATFDPDGWGSWNYGAGWFEYQEWLYIHDGTDKLVKTVNPYHEDRVSGNGYLTDEADVANGPGSIGCKYAPNLYDPDDFPNTQTTDGPDAVAFYGTNGKVNVCPSTPNVNPIEITDFTPTYMNSTYGIVVTESGQIHVLYPGCENFSPYRQGIKDRIVSSTGTVGPYSIHVAPIYGGHNEEILDVAPTRESGSSDAFDILVTHYSEDEGNGTIENITYVERVSGGSGSSNPINENYSTIGQLGATTSGNVALLPSGSILVFATK